MSIASTIIPVLRSPDPEAGSVNRSSNARRWRDNAACSWTHAPAGFDIHAGNMDKGRMETSQLMPSTNPGSTEMTESNTPNPVDSRGFRGPSSHTPLMRQYLRRVS
ncbi:MAG: hypothetical protein IPH43_06425 [Xanthomonadales bacterium]|nr:hypothetical protein [Xanthomonadales bacterium]